MTHEDMLQMFADIFLCLVGAVGVSVMKSDVPEDSNYKRYNYQLLKKQNSLRPRRLSFIIVLWMEVM